MFVLPSSIHETIIVPAGKVEDPEALNAMVSKVNKEAVKREDILSDHAYFFSRETGVLAAA